MNRTRAFNIAVGCIMASSLSTEEKREVIEELRLVEEELEQDECCE